MLAPIIIAALFLEFFGLCKKLNVAHESFTQKNIIWNKYDIIGFSKNDIYFSHIWEEQVGLIMNLRYGALRAKCKVYY